MEHVPDGLVREPAGVALVQAVLKSSPELFWRSDGGARGVTGLHRSGKVQRVAASFSSVVEHHACRGSGKKACEESERFAQ